MNIVGAPLTELQSKIEDEIGSLGLETYAGYVRAAYNAELYWPTCFPLYDRIRRSDPEVALIRNIWTSFARDIDFQWIIDWEDPTDADKEAVDFGDQVLDDIYLGLDVFVDTMVSYVPFLGFGVWEIVPGLRRKGWVSPDKTEWESQYNDNRIGVRKLAWRDHSSFERWDVDDTTGDVLGFVQRGGKTGETIIPFNQSIHLTFGDPHNPEGLAPLEAVWRLERIKYGLEVVQGIGFEHAAGHAKFEVEDEITADDRSIIAKAARAILTAQEGNYMTLPKKIQGSIVDVNFGAAGAILEAIRYFGLLKLQVFNMQWVAIASTAGTGAYSAMSDASRMFLDTYNAMMAGFADQTGRQLGKWLFSRNEFPGMTRRPKLVATPVEKMIPLTELSTFMQAFAMIFPLSEEDVKSIRRKSGFLSESLPLPEEIYTEPSKVKPEEEPEGGEEVPEAEPEPGEEESEPESESEGEEESEEEEKREEKLQRALMNFRFWCYISSPEVYTMLEKYSTGKFPKLSMKDLSQENMMSNIKSCVRALWTGEWDVADFYDSMSITIERGIYQAFEEGLAKYGIAMEDMTGDENAVMFRFMADQVYMLDGFAQSIADGSKANGGLLSTHFTRAELWANRYKEAVSLAAAMAAKDQNLRWDLGATEKHCSSCLRLAGKVKRGSLWFESGILPQSQVLECKGYHCQCALTPTTEPASRGPLPSL